MTCLRSTEVLMLDLVSQHYHVLLLEHMLTDVTHFLHCLLLVKLFCTNRYSSQVKSRVAYRRNANTALDGTQDGQLITSPDAKCDASA